MVPTMAEVKAIIKSILGFVTTAEFRRQSRRYWADFNRYINCFGYWPGIIAYFKIKLAKSENISINIPQSRTKIILRAATSDIKVFEQIFIDKDYEIKLPIDPKYIIDAGANIGLATIVFANAYPNAHILSVEPEESNYTLLKKNTAKYLNVHPLKAGIWGKPAFLRIENPKADQWSFQLEETTKSGEINAITIENAMQILSTKRIDLLKLDIEGAEIEVFSSNVSWLENVDVIIIELHDRLRAGCRETVQEAIASYSFSQQKHGENIIFTHDSQFSIVTKKD